MVNALAHGQWIGIRRVGRPERLTSRPGIARSRVRRVRATINWFSTRTRPAIAVPADHVVSEDGALQPNAVGVEVAGRDVLESAALFEVADREFDNGVLTVELVEFDGGAVEVGEEPEVAPVRPQFQLVFVGQACASHDQPACHSSFAAPVV